MNATTEFDTSTTVWRSKIGQEGTYYDWYHIERKNFDELYNLEFEVRMPIDWFARIVRIYKLERIN